MALQSELNSRISPSDPLLASADLPHRAFYFPFGFPAQIETNDRRVIRAAHRNWSDTRLHFADTPVVARILVSKSENAVCPLAPPVYRAQRNLLAITADPENFASCDLASGFGAAWVNEAVVEQVEYFRYCFLLGLIGSMIEARHLVSLHAACVSMDGQGILLSGDSGAGKSSLSFACAQRGFTYVSDDCSSIVRRRPGRSIVGTPGSIRFRESAGKLFGELEGRQPEVRLNRQPSIEVRTAELGIKTALEAFVDHIVLLARADKYGTRAELVPVSKTEARARLHSDVWPQELPSTREQHDAVDRVLEAGTYELRYRDLEPAVERLKLLVRSGQ